LGAWTCDYQWCVDCKGLREKLFGSIIAIVLCFKLFHQASNLSRLLQDGLHKFLKSVFGLAGGKQEFRIKKGRNIVMFNCLTLLSSLPILCLSGRSQVFDHLDFSFLTFGSIASTGE